MEFMSASEAAKRWGISLRQVQRLLSGNRIPGVRRYGRAWLLPADADKPVNLHQKKLTPSSSFSDLPAVITATTKAMPLNNPDAILDTIGDERFRHQYEAELAYLRGDFEHVMLCFQKTAKDDVSRLRICPVAIAAAISLGDYKTYIEIEAYLKQCIKVEGIKYVTTFAEMALATAAVSAIAPNLAPGWLKEGDFSNLLPEVRMNAIYLRAKYFLCMGKIEAMLTAAQTALSLSTSHKGITITDIYLMVTRAVAHYYLGHAEKAKHNLLEVMRICLPHGFITPFAESVINMGGMVEACLDQEFPTFRNTVINQCNRTWKNWVSFHNHFTKDNITLILSLREYHMALLAARRVPYAEIARQHCISVGRVKNIMLDIYSKLYISGRDELAKYIL